MAICNPKAIVGYSITLSNLLHFMPVIWNHIRIHLFSNPHPDVQVKSFNIWFNHYVPINVIHCHWNHKWMHQLRLQYTTIFIFIEDVLISLDFEELWKRRVHFLAGLTCTEICTTNSLWNVCLDLALPKFYRHHFAYYATSGKTYWNM